MKALKRLFILTLSFLLLLTFTTPLSHASQNFSNVGADDAVTVETSDSSADRSPIPDGEDYVYQWGGFASKMEMGGLSTKSVPEWETQALKDHLYRRLLMGDTFVDVSDYHIPRSDNNSLFELVWSTLNEHGDLYAMMKRSEGYAYYYTSNGITYLKGFDVTYNSTLDGRAFRRETQKALSVLRPDMNDFEKAVALHDYLVLHCAFDNEGCLQYSPGIIPGNVYNAYGALVERRAVCLGYAVAYKYLCNLAGIECYMVDSDVMGHAWNLIRLGGQLYHVDSTWDDPVWDRYGLVSHAFMFKSDDYFQHRTDGHGLHYSWKVTSGGHIADLKATDTTYDQFYWDNVTSPMVRDAQGYWYYINGDRQLKKSNSLQFGESGVSGYSSRILKTLDAWRVTGGIYVNPYSGLILTSDHTLYYNDSSGVYACDLWGGSERSVCSPGSSLYGIGLENGTLCCAVRDTPYSDRSNYLLHLSSGIQLESPYIPTKKSITQCAVSLDNVRLTYNGSAQKPAFFLTDEGVIMDSGSDYTVSCPNSVSPGSYSVTFTGKGDYYGTVTLSYTITGHKDSITASDVTKTASAKAQSFSLKVSHKSAGKLSFASSDKKVKVDSKGKVTIPAKFSGKVKITIKSQDKGEYQGASKTITLTVNKRTDSITAPNATKTASAKDQSFLLKVSHKSTGALSFASSSKKVKVDSKGKVTIPKMFAGSVKITIKSQSKGEYAGASKTVTLTVKLAGTSFTSVKSISSDSVSVKWQKDPLATGYLICISPDKKINEKGCQYVDWTDLKQNAVKIVRLNAKGKTRYIGIRSYRVVDGQRIYSDWSTIISVKIKK